MKQLKSQEVQTSTCLWNQHPLGKAEVGLFSEMSLTIYLNLFPPTETLFVCDWVDVVEEGKCVSFIPFKNKRGIKA